MTDNLINSQAIKESLDYMQANFTEENVDEYLIACYGDDYTTEHRGLRAQMMELLKNQTLTAKFYVVVDSVGNYYAWYVQAEDENEAKNNVVNYLKANDITDITIETLQVEGYYYQKYDPNTPVVNPMSPDSASDAFIYILR